MNLVKKTIAAALIFAVMNGCTSNPVGEEQIGGGKRTLKGSIRLDKNGHPNKAYVWYEGFGIGTFTDETGDFSVTLPVDDSRKVTGVYGLHFFVANYKLKTIEISVRNNEFLFDTEFVDRNGILRDPVRMEKFLSVTPSVVPPAFRFNADGAVIARLTLQTIATVSDTATVVIPRTTPGFLGPILVQNIVTGDTRIIANPLVSTQEAITVGASPVTRAADFVITNLNLAPGNYQLVPFMLIHHQTLPDGLLDAIGANLNELTASYLNMPYAREGGGFIVTN